MYHGAETNLEVGSFSLKNNNNRSNRTNIKRSLVYISSIRNRITYLPTKDLRTLDSSNVLLSFGWWSVKAATSVVDLGPNSKLYRDTHLFIAIIGHLCSRRGNWWSGV